MNKEQIIAFRAKWGIPYRVLADKIGITPKCLSDKMSGKAKQTLNATNIQKINEVLKEMSSDLSGL